MHPNPAWRRTWKGKKRDYYQNIFTLDFQVIYDKLTVV